jgi:hypothetical protein
MEMVQGKRGTGRKGRIPEENPPLPHSHPFNQAVAANSSSMGITFSLRLNNCSTTSAAS